MGSNNFEKANTNYRWRGEWATSTAYLKYDTFEHDGSGYITLIPHTSGTFATDLANGKVELYVDGWDASATETLTNKTIDGDDNTLQDIGIGSLKMTTLYYNASGTTSTITLSETSANFDYIDIYFKTSNGSYDFSRVYSPNGKSVNLLSGNYYSGNGVFYIQSAVVAIATTSITWTSNRQISLATTPAIGSGGGNYILITRIIGYIE